jgi:tetratricopeptide (TPR) repeat protein
MKIFFVIIFLLTALLATAQPGQVKKLYNQTKKWMTDGEYESAASGFKELLQKDGNNLDVLKDWVYFNLLTKNYIKVIEVGKAIIERPDADEQTYQLLGMGYKAIRDFENCEKIYQRGFHRFPKSGVLFNEFGEMYAIENNFSNAIIQWEKGIEAEPNYSSNYYNATIYYSKMNTHVFNMLLYGEVFCNLESYTIRTAEVKEILFEAWQNLLIQKIKLPSDNASAFEKAFAEALNYITSKAQQGSSIPEILTATRTKFLLSWFAKKQNNQFPFYLFNQQQYFLQEGMFDAYNQWLFGPVASTSSYQIWLNTHDAEAKKFKELQQTRLFKMPVGQYYK